MQGRGPGYRKSPVNGYNPPSNIAIIGGKPAITGGAFVRVDTRIDHWSERIEPALDEFAATVVVSIALPLAAMMVLFGMRVMDIPVHQVSVTGLIIAPGLLIDNAIVIVDEVSSRLRAGLSASAAAAESVAHLALPLAGSTVTESKSSLLIKTPIRIGFHGRAESQYSGWRKSTRAH